MIEPNDTRSRLLATTAALFQRQGYNGTSIKQITDGAEATTGSLYHFFPGGKDELAIEVIITSGAAYLDMFKAIASLDNISTADAMGMLFDGASETLENSDYVDACPIFTVAHEVASANEDLRKACDQVFSDWMRTATLMFRKAGLTNKRADELATTVVAAIGGAFILARTAKNADLMRATGRDIAHLVRLLTEPPKTPAKSTRK
jgi:TetR/AcrR family transcriptional regulator, lmrAB and yxaGH operons repressor